ncbi:MAG: alanine racemase, partial [Alphaproteobacteria bacterium 65-7]
MDAAARRPHPGAMPDNATSTDTETDFEAARLTVRLPAIAANYRTYQRTAGPARVAAVVKGDAYGLGAARIVPALAAAGCDSFFVARLAEGVALRAVVPQARIFVLDGAQPDAIPALLTHRLTPVLNSLSDIAAWRAAAAASRTVLDAVLQVDTGMNRLGLPGEELAVLAAEARARLSGLNPVLVMSHLACADDEGADKAMNARQLDRFRTALAMLPPAPASLAASSGTMLGMDYHFDMVRPGVALYGANPQAGRPNLMQTAAVVTARVLQVRRIDSGDTVGYAATFRARRPSMIATLALGYADGIPRAASGRGQAAFGGVRAPFAGRVSMDMITLDVTDMAHPPAPGDAAELLGD